MWRKLQDTVAGFNEGHLLRLLVAFVLISSIGSMLISVWRLPDTNATLLQWWEAWLRSVSAELLGVAVLLLGIRLILGKSERSLMKTTLEVTADNQNKQRMALTKSYLNRLRTLPTREARQPILDEMKLQNLLIGINFNNINLEGANFYDANLSGASLENCNLRGAYFIESNLSGAKLTDADLSNAELSWADLSKAFLGGAKLDGAWLLQANLENAYVKSTHFSVQTRLPDGTRWTPNIKIERYADPSHPQFWRPEPGFFGELPRWFRRRQAS